jgi:hypothetical protein
MTDALTALATGPRDNFLAQYIGLQDVLRMVDDCPEIDALLATSKKDLLDSVARDMVVTNETKQLDLNLARNVVELLPLLVNRPAFEDGVCQECANILDRSLDFLENESFVEQPGQSEKSRQSQLNQLSNLTRLHLEFWSSQTLSKSLNEKHVRRMTSLLEKYWQKAEDAQKARDDDWSNITESTYEKACSVQTRLNVLQKLLYQVPGLMTKNAKRWLMRLLEETLSRHPEVRRTATDIGITTAYDMGARKEIAQAMLSIMNNPSKTKNRTYVERRIAGLEKRLMGKDSDKDLLPLSWVVPLLYMQYPEVKVSAWAQLVTYRDVLRDCFKLPDREMKLACWEALRKLISAEFGDHHDAKRLGDFWLWMKDWIRVCFESAENEGDLKSPIFLSGVYTYFRLVQKAVPTAQHADDDYLRRVWELCVRDIMIKLDKKGKTRTHKVLACRILAALFGKPRGDIVHDIWVEHQEFGAGLKDIQPFNDKWIRSHLPQMEGVILPFLQYDILSSDGNQAIRTDNNELQRASTCMWEAFLHAVAKAENYMDFTSSGRKELKKVMANITNLLSNLWRSIISTPSADFAIPRFFSLLFIAVDTLGAANFTQNYIFSTNGGSLDAFSPSTQKGQKPQSPCLHLTSLFVKSLFSKSKVCETRHLLPSLGKLWNLCLNSRNTAAEKLEYLQSLSDTIYNEFQREGVTLPHYKQANLVFTTILKLATDTFPVSGAPGNGPTFDRQPYDHALRILEIALDCTTPDWQQTQTLYAAMVSSIKAEAVSLIKAKPGRAGYLGYVGDAGDASIAILLTVPHARMILHHLDDTRPISSKPSPIFLIEYATMIIRHDTRPKSRVDFKDGRELFSGINDIPKTIELHCGNYHRAINQIISTLYNRGLKSVDFETRLTQLIDALIEHIERTPESQPTIVTFIQDAISLLIEDKSSKVFSVIALADKVRGEDNGAGDRHFFTNFDRLSSCG